MVIVITGVTGAGKSTIGRLLADELQWRFHDADDLHPRANIEKMERGVPLQDADRMPWLEALRGIIHAALERRENAVIASSALKDSYRRMLKIGPEVVLVYLMAEPELVRERLKHRLGHFMNPGLVRSQFEALDRPDGMLQVDAELAPQEIVRVIRDQLSV